MISFLPHLYCDPIYGVTCTTRGVPMGSLARLGVYLRITCTVRRQLHYVYGVARTTEGVPTGPLARLGVYLRIIYIEYVPTITRTTRDVPMGLMHDLGVFVWSHSLRCAP